MFQALVFGFLTLACWRLLRRFFSRTALDNVPGPSPSSFWTGSLSDLYNPKAWDFHKKIVETYGGVIRVKGFFGSNFLYVSDPTALHHVLVKDQNFYGDTKGKVEITRMMFGEGMFSSAGERHRVQRKMLNPVFSIVHMREMVLIFYEVGHKLRDTFLQKVANGPQEVDVIAWMTRCALELIGRSGLGYSFDTLADDSVPHRFADVSKQLIELMPIVTKIGTARFRRAIVNLIPLERVKQIRYIIDVCHETSVEIFESKKKALQEGDEALAAQIGRGKDIISILMRANMVASEEDKLSDAELLGQVTSLTFAATDTTSGALSRIFHLLALHKDVQEKVRKEIQDAKKENGGKDLSYDTLVSLPYLDAICRETLRLYPPVPVLQRDAQRDIVLPLAVPIKGTNGKEINALPIPKGTRIHVSIIGSNRNPEMWGPDAYEWKPERWLNPLPDSLINARIPGVYSHLLTFLGGGRSCIGFKFSQLEMKVILVLLLEKIEFSLSDKNVVWQMTPIITPNVDMVSTTPTMPMNLSLVDSNV
ncbi:cytochrome P450 [Phlegmacium glaucopus]|nr:cytochrome P450 [Phlegmacium glaucopus]